MQRERKAVAVATEPENGVDELDAEHAEQQARELVVRAVQRIHERDRDRDPYEVLAIVTEIVEEVRQERYERDRPDGMVR